jgi:hypothetical protein
MEADLRAHLLRQLGFLWRSCRSYDEGHLEEALRIATVIRVLIHDTPASTSLLKHLGAQNTLLSSTVSSHTDAMPVWMSGMGRLRITATESARIPNLDPAALQVQMPAREWWGQVVYIYGQVRATRKSLVLGAANKDGGAHVDTKLNKEYEALMLGGLHGWFHYSPKNDGTFQPVMNEHFLYLRQMGFELLNSPDLLALSR